MIRNINVHRGDLSQLHGSWRIAPPSGAVTTVAAGGHLLAMQFVSATKLARLRYLAARFVTSTAFGAAQEVGCNAFVGRTFSAPDTGGTAIVLTGNNGKFFSPMPAASAFADARVAGAAALTAGTVTLDDKPFASTSGFSSGVGLTIGTVDKVLYDARFWLDDNGLALADKVVFGNNEGLIITNSVLMGATGVGRWQFEVEWDEVQL